MSRVGSDHYDRQHEQVSGIIAALRAGPPGEAARRESC